MDEKLKEVIELYGSLEQDKKDEMFVQTMLKIDHLEVKFKELLQLELIKSQISNKVVYFEHTTSKTQ